jgi:hypothetical protein
MRKFFLLLLAAVCLLASCKKSSTNTPTTSNTFTAKVNGTTHTFTVDAATFIRSVTDNQKRLDITGTSEDGNFRLILTIGEETAVGNGILTGAHPVRWFLDDDPATSEDESIDSDAIITLSTKIGSSWLTDVYKQYGQYTVSANNISGTTISGTFTGTLTSMGGGTNYSITEGSFSNIKYTVLN